ncbi:MAG: LemA family protein [Candidatus Nanogingivalaceae bacterium]|jgi:LemA family protein|nr:LemA family protein [Candidatus Nanogingivalaceae bacterium]
MKKWKIPAIIGGVLLLIVMMIAGSYNGMVSSRESVNTAWSKVESQYQRRSDLIPNLVNTVKGAANFEQETLTKVIEARSKATQIKVDANNPEDIARFQQAQSQVSSSLSRLLAVAENYPQLKATENFKDLQSQLEGTENRITVARNDFNDAARSYNTKIKSFPANLLAGMFGFKERPYFEADADAKKAPSVNFGTPTKQEN